MAMEEARRDLQRRLEEVLGKDHAFTLMTQLPRDEPATRTDLKRVETSLSERVDATRTEFKAELRAVEERLSERIDLKVEASEHRLLAEMHDLRSEMHQEIGTLRKDMVAQTRVFLFSTLTAVIAVGGLPLVTGRLG